MSGPTWTQLPLPFTQARSTDPATSHAAARDAQWNARTHRALVLATLRSSDGLTDFELADITGLGDNARKRRSDLKNLGLAYDSGMRRRSPTGSQAIVWVAVPAAEV